MKKIKSVSNKNPSPQKVVANYDLEGVEKFSGFDFSVAEGLKLSERSYTEIPGLSEESNSES